MASNSMDVNSVLAAMEYYVFIYTNDSIQFYGVYVSIQYMPCTNKYREREIFLLLSDLAKIL